MIKNLNPLTFYKYGQVNQFTTSNEEEDESYEYEEKTLVNNTLFNLQKYSHKTCIHMVEGITLIYVSLTPKDEDIEVFLLDKPITINPQVYYGIIPYCHNCKLLLGKKKNTHKQFYNLSQPLKPVSINPDFDILNIHTLFYQEKENNFIFKGESHDFWELTYVDRGTLITEIDKEVFELQQGDLIFYTPAQFHAQKSDTNEELAFMTITFDMAISDENFLKNTIFKANREIKELMEKINIENANSTLYSNDLILCYLKELVIKLIRSIKLPHHPHHLDTDIQNNVENALVLQAIEYIHSHIEKKLTVTQIATTIPISASYLSKVFKKQTNKTVIEYINDYKLKKK